MNDGAKFLRNDPFVLYTKIPVSVYVKILFESKNTNSQ
jgi:hypothetical protein